MNDKAFGVDELSSLLSSEIEGAQVRVQGSEGRYQVRIVSDFFSGLNRVKRQQAVYRILNPYITSGAIHAISMELLTAEELSETRG